MKKLRIGIIFGGVSSEKEISLESGRHLWQLVDKDKYEPIPVFWDKKLQLWHIPVRLVVQNTTEDINNSLSKDPEAKPIPWEQLKNHIDFALLGVHGKFGEDGSLQGMLEVLGVPYSGSGVLTSALGMNKHMQRLVYKEAGLEVADYRVVSRHEKEKNAQNLIEEIAGHFTFPLIIKPIAEGCSTALSKVKNKEEILPALEAVFVWDEEALVEEYIQGTEVTTTVIGNDDPTCLPPTETPPSAGNDYLTLEDKFLPGGAKMITPARLEPADMEKLKQDMVTAYTALGVKGYCRIDAFVRNHKIIINEANTLPGATPSTCLFQQAAEVGMTLHDFVDKIIQFGLEAHRDKKGPL